MSATWRVLVGALLGVGVTGPDVSDVERVSAAAALLVMATLDRRGLGLVTVAAVVGAAGGARLDARIDRATVWADRESDAVVRFVARDHGDVWAARAAHADAPAVDVRLSRVPESVVAGDVWRAHLRLYELPRRRNPDDRRALRSALASGRLLRGRVLALDERLVRGGGPSPPGRVVEVVADRWRQRLGNGAGLWRALLLADRRGLDRAATESVQRLGLAHLLALSGLHVGMVVGIVALPLRGRGARGLVCALPVLVVWTVLAGAGSSMLRAVAMFVVVVVGRCAHRRASASEALAVAGFLEIVVRPEAVCGIGWWLSYGATLAIVRAAPTLSTWPRPVAALAVSFVAQAATLPWILDAFGRLPWASAFVLLVIGPLFGLVLVVGGVAALLALLPLPGASGSAGVAALVAHAFGWTVQRAGPVGELALSHPGFPDAAWALFVALTAWWLVPHRWFHGRGSLVGTFGLLVVLHVTVWRPPRHEWVSFDVGQGDAGVYRCGDRAVVVDTGPLGRGWHPIDRSLRAYLDRRPLDVRTVVLTHGHLDHIAGTRRLLRRHHVEALGVARTDREFRWGIETAGMADSLAVDVRWLASGDELWSDCCRPQVFWPGADTHLEHANDRSVVLRVGPLSRPLLLTGDLERAGERGLLELTQGLEPGEWILKVAHHGGDTGTDMPLLERLRPRWGIVSCGVGNSYGHPHPAVLDRLDAAGIGVLRTDRHGAVRVRWSAEHVRVDTVVPRP